MSQSVLNLRDRRSTIGHDRLIVVYLINVNRLSVRACKNIDAERMIRCIGFNVQH